MIEFLSGQDSGERCRRQCVMAVTPALHRLVDALHHDGWSREELLVAIGDAADQVLFDLTDRPHRQFRRPVATGREAQALAMDHPVEDPPR